MDKPIPEGVLLPCPFCGGEPTPADDWLLVECLECTYSLDVPGYATIRGPKAAMVEHWNRREGCTLTAAQQQGQAVACTCPSGDGSLRWPCPAHPAEAQGGGGWCVERPGDPTLPQWDEVRSLIVPAPPSAPVGVEGLLECLPLEVRSANGYDAAWAAGFNEGVLQSRQNLHRALAQQPAAVDEARAMELWDEFREAGHHERDALICVLQALATQHQEPTT